MLVMVIMTRVVGWSRIWGVLSGARWRWLTAVYGVALIHQLIAAQQLRLILMAVQVSLPLRRIFLASQLASLYSLILPGDTASAVKWANLAVASRKRSLVLNALIYNKLLMLAAPLLVGTIALIIDDPFQQRWVSAVSAVTFFALIGLMVLLYHPAVGRNVEHRLRSIGDRLPEPVARRIGYALTSLGSVRRMDHRDHTTLASFALVGVGLGVIRVWCGIQALDLGVSVFSVLWILAFTVIGRFLPITIANLGIREGLLVAALVPLGVPSEEAVALGLLGFSAIVMLALIGAGYQVALTIGWAQAGPPTAPGSPDD
jgi:hypothetical protein